MTSVILSVRHSVSSNSRMQKWTSTKHGRLGQGVTLWEWLTYDVDLDPRVHSRWLFYFFTIAE